ncbi:hypothetical protein I316_04482 [Kwoniella heveanensis BCC8398]|uniref:Ricin B lectin domain-containing protein n=1 Tax=Kwoniella heveanensis BCC8398 TaxID=1296120 RepID=A0A1B9GRS0_9TREE|nr:hypothetical protein I316_04482 [Kwoniella heveanensis BCC8398]
MFFATSLTTILLALLSVSAPLISASPTPATKTHLSKRYTGVRIQSYRDGTCLTPYGPRLYDGIQVRTTQCQYAPRWDISPGSGSVLLHENNNYALDAGTGRDNNEIVKMWTSYPGLFQQTWYLTDDYRIAITGGDQCLDQGDNYGTQTYRCTTGNTNQVWNILFGDDLGASPVPLPQPVDPEPVYDGEGEGDVGGDDGPAPPTPTDDNTPHEGSNPV